MTILNDYHINKFTLALIPAKHFDYDTIVWEKDHVLYVKQPVLDLIKKGCLNGGAKFDGRKASVAHLTKSQNKTPIPINPLQHIYAFPTHSPKNKDCTWIIYEHIKDYTPYQKEKNRSVLIFKNDKELLLDLSFHSLERQVHRTAHCVTHFSGLFDQSPLDQLKLLLQLKKLLSPNPFNELGGMSDDSGIV